MYSESVAQEMKRWNDRFSADGFVFGKEVNQYLKDAALLHIPKNSRVLCVADGEGRNSVWLAKNNYVVDAFDISEVGINKAKKFAQENSVNVHYELNDLDHFQWPENSYDAIACIFIQFAPPEMRQRAFEHMIKSLKPGGILIVQGYTPKQLGYKTGGPSIESHLYTENLLKDSFKSLQILDLKTYEAQLNEGAGHAGISALIGMTAKKPIN